MPWIFAYGSLMWDFDLEYEERVEGLLDGYHRSFNKKSTRNWGTRETPGPVLGLDPGGECRGIVFRISDDVWDRVVSEIDDREGPSYDARDETVQLTDGRTVTTRVWINDRERFTYIGDRSVEERARMSVEASGTNGSAQEYALETWRELQALGIDDSHVEAFVQQVCAIADEPLTGED